MNVDFLGRVSLRFEDFLLVTKFAEKYWPWGEKKVQSRDQQLATGSVGARDSALLRHNCNAANWMDLLQLTCDIDSKENTLWLLGNVRCTVFSEYMYIIAIFVVLWRESGQGRYVPSQDRLEQNMSLGARRAAVGN